MSDANSQPPQKLSEKPVVSGDFNLKGAYAILVKAFLRNHPDELGMENQEEGTSHG